MSHLLKLFILPIFLSHYTTYQDVNKEIGIIMIIAVYKNIILLHCIAQRICCGKNIYYTRGVVSIFQLSLRYYSFSSLKNILFLIKIHFLQGPFLPKLY